MVGLLEPLRLLLLCALTATVWETTLAGCPPGDWRHYNGHCYYPSTLTADWSAARQVCLSLGADLASIEDSAENSFIVESMMDVAYIWVGLNDISDEGTYRWTDGSTSTYRYWYPGEPNDVDTQNCIVIGGSSGLALGQWWDDNCAAVYSFMCKMAEY